jgi:exosortase A
VSAVLGIAQPASRWRQALVAWGAVLLALVVLFRETLLAMVEIWSRSDTFAHAFLVPPIAVWLVWRQRAALSAEQPRPQPWLLAALALAGAGWLFGQLASINALSQLAVTALIVLSVPAVLGLRVASRIAFPLVFLFFMVPIGEFLLPVLMERTADFTVGALQLSGVPVYREGLKFVIPTGSWSVVEACSGVRYLIASFMVGTLFAYLNYRSTRRRVLFGLVSIAVPVVANWLRAYMIVMLGHLSDNRIATGVDHLVYGWLFFGVVIVLMFFIGARWSESPAAAEAAAPARAPAAPWRGWPTALAAVAVVTAPHLLLRVVDDGVRRGAPALALPAVPGWRAAPPAAVSTPYQPVFKGAALALDGHYTRAEGATVGVHIAYYRGQGPGRKLVSSENVLVRADDKRWNPVSDGKVDVGAMPMRRVEVLDAGFAGSGQRTRLELRQLYWADGRWAASAERAALDGLVGRLRGHGDDAAGIVLSAAGDDPQTTASVLDAFVRDALPAIEQALRAAGR